MRKYICQLLHGGFPGCQQIVAHHYLCIFDDIKIMPTHQIIYLRHRTGSRIFNRQYTIVYTPILHSLKNFFKCGVILNIRMCKELFRSLIGICTFYPLASHFCIFRQFRLCQHNGIQFREICRRVHRLFLCRI